MSLRILVVEDFQPFRRLICTALQRRAEFQTTEAADGLEAVQKAEALQPDLILLDINLPKLHGFEVAKQIRSLAPHARLLFMSQESSSDIVRKALSLGADGYVQKLSAGTDLLPAIDAVLGGQRFVSQQSRVYRTRIVTVTYCAAGTVRSTPLISTSTRRFACRALSFLFRALIVGSSASAVTPDGHSIPRPSARILSAGIW